jgi:hypothetical protein
MEKREELEPMAPGWVDDATVSYAVSHQLVPKNCIAPGKEKLETGASRIRLKERRGSRNASERSGLPGIALAEVRHLSPEGLSVAPAGAFARIRSPAGRGERRAMKQEFRIPLKTEVKAEAVSQAERAIDRALVFGKLGLTRQKLDG